MDDGVEGEGSSLVRLDLPPAGEPDGLPSDLSGPAPRDRPGPQVSSSGPRPRTRPRPAAPFPASSGRRWLWSPAQGWRRPAGIDPVPQSKQTSRVPGPRPLRLLPGRSRSQTPPPPFAVTPSGLPSVWAGSPHFPSRRLSGPDCPGRPSRLPSGLRRCRVSTTVERTRAATGEPSIDPAVSAEPGTQRLLDRGRESP